MPDPVFGITERPWSWESAIK